MLFRSADVKLSDEGSKIRLADVDPDFHGPYKSEKDAQKHLDQQSASISDLQKKLYAERKHSLLIVLQGIDAAGKDGCFLRESAA